MQVDGKVNVEAVIALAKVIEVAISRGEQMVLRASFASKEDIQLCNNLNMAKKIAIPMVESN